MKFIDPVEACLAVVGVQAIISREVEKVNLSDVREMEGLSKWCYNAAKAVVNGEVSGVPITTISYKKMLGLLTEEFDAGQLEQMVAKFPPALSEISGEFLVKSGQVVQLLRQLFPVATKETLLGPTNVMPSALAIRKFAVLLDVLDGPKRTLSHIACGSLLKSQADVVKEVYPTFAECLTDALTEAGVNAKAAKKSFQLPARVEIGYGVWAGIPRVGAKLQTQLQKNFSQSDAEAKKPAGASGTSTSVAAKAAMTGTQSATYSTSLGG